MVVRHPGRILGDHQIRRWESRGYLNVPSLPPSLPPSALQATQYHLELRAALFPGSDNEDEDNSLRLNNF